MVNCNQEKSFHEGENKVIEKKVKKNQSVEKVLQIIELLVSQGGEMRLQDIADQVNSPSSTVLRYLSTLSSFGYVYQNADSSKYALTLKLAQLGSLVSGQYDIRNLVHDDLVALSKEFQESSCLAIEEDHEVVYIDVINGPDNMLKTMQRIGKRAPVTCDQRRKKYSSELHGEGNRGHPERKRNAGIDRQNPHNTRSSFQRVGNCPRNRCSDG